MSWSDRSPNGTEPTKNLTRRRVLSLLGTSAVALSGVGVAAAGGDREDIEPSVETREATDIEFDSALLNAYLEIWGDDGGELCFEYRPEGTSDWQIVDCRYEDEVDELYSMEVTGLEPDTTYEFRAHVTNDEGEEDYGGVLSFTTTQDTPPSIESFKTREYKHRCSVLTTSVEVVWEVSDPEANLDTVEIEWENEDGTLIDRQTQNVSGGSASGSNTSDCGESNSDWEITLSVTDGNDNTTSKSKTVSTGLL